MNKAYGLGVAFGMIFAIAAAFIISRRQKQRGKEPQFDERERIVRAKAGNHAFLAIMFYAVLYELAVLISGRSFMEDGVSLMLSIFVGLTVFAIESIWRSAYFAHDENRKTKVILFAVVCVAQIANAIASIMDGRLMSDGLLTIAVLNPAAAFVFFVLMIAIVLRVYLDRRLEEAEDEDE